MEEDSKEDLIICGKHFCKDALSDEISVKLVRMGCSSSSFFGMMPLNISEFDFNGDRKMFYFIAEKKDGMRAMIIVFENKMYVLFRSGIVYSIHIDNSNKDYYVLDCEIMSDRFVILDVVAYNSSFGDKFVKRLVYVRKLGLAGSMFGFKVEPQIYCNASVYFEKHKNFEEVNGIDGLILIDIQSFYVAGSNHQNIYKWKPARFSSIDLQVNDGVAKTSDGDVVELNCLNNAGIIEYNLSSFEVSVREAKPANSTYVALNVFSSMVVTYDVLVDYYNNGGAVRRRTMDELREHCRRNLVINYRERIDRVVIEEEKKDDNNYVVTIEEVDSPIEVKEKISVDYDKCLAPSEGEEVTWETYRNRVVLLDSVVKRMDNPVLNYLFDDKGHQKGEMLLVHKNRQHIHPGYRRCRERYKVFYSDGRNCKCSIRYSVYGFDKVYYFSRSRGVELEDLYKLVCQHVSGDFRYDKGTLRYVGDDKKFISNVSNAACQRNICEGGLRSDWNDAWYKKGRKKRNNK